MRGCGWVCRCGFRVCEGLVRVWGIRGRHWVWHFNSLWWIHVVSSVPWSHSKQRSDDGVYVCGLQHFNRWWLRCALKAGVPRRSRVLFVRAIIYVVVFEALPHFFRERARFAWIGVVRRSESFGRVVGVCDVMDMGSTF